MTIGASDTKSSNGGPNTGQVAVEVVTIVVAPRHLEAICPLVPVEAGRGPVRDLDDVPVEVGPGRLHRVGGAGVVRVQQESNLRVGYVVLPCWPAVATALEDFSQGVDYVIDLPVVWDGFACLVGIFANTEKGDCCF